MTALWTTLGIAGSGVIAALIGMVGTRSAMLRHIKDEADVIAALPEGSDRRRDVEAASDIHAARYLAHAEAPQVRRRWWVTLFLSIALYGGVLSMASTTDLDSLDATGVGLIAIGIVACLGAVQALTRLTRM